MPHTNQPQSATTCLKTSTLMDRILTRKMRHFPREKSTVGSTYVLYDASITGEHYVTAEEKGGNRVDGGGKGGVAEGRDRERKMGSSRTQMRVHRYDVPSN